MKGRHQGLRSEGKERLESLEIVLRIVPDDTVTSDKLVPKDKVVVFFDICSSSKLLEDLQLTGNLKHYRNLLIAIKDFLLAEESKGLCEMYKFIGDGWVVLLPRSIKGEQFIDLLYRLADLFERELQVLRSRLESTPDVLGLTFGADKGQLIKLTMGNQDEYIGRPLNIAARLQGAVKDNDSNPAYKILISKHAFDDLKIPPKYQATHVKRTLRNIKGGSDYKCVKLTVLNPALGPESEDKG